MKRTVSVILILAILLALSLPAAPGAEAAVQPRLTYIITPITTLSISQQGVATCFAQMETATNYPVVLIIRLQQDKSTHWATLAEWTINGTGFARGTKYYSTVESGYTYRTFVLAAVYDNDGNFLEGITVSCETYF